MTKHCIDGTTFFYVDNIKITLNVVFFGQAMKKG